MNYMFFYCNSLTNLDLSSFDTSNVAYFSSIFSDCTNLEVLRTPKKHTESGVTLPLTMYDNPGNAYTELPVLSKSIVLGKTQKIAHEYAAKPISECTVTLKPTSYTYDGKTKKPAVTVKDGTKTLTSGTDYTAAYSKNKNAGTAVVTITATETGNYKGTKTANFTIKKADAGLAFAESSIKKKSTDAAFTNALTKATTAAAAFTSDNTAVATVDSATGEVTIKGVGTATIKAETKAATNYNAGSATYLLTVEAPPTPTATGFSDVQNPSHAYYKAIYWAADAGITKGYPDGTFGINRDCTRGEMMMFLWRYAGKKEPTPVSKSPFKDVPKTHTFYKAILWGSQKGITKGYPDGTFGINKNVSRGECMMFLWRLKGKPAPKAVAKAPFPDVPKSHVFYNAVLWGYQNKITTGFTSGKLKGKFGVNENCSRGQIVTFLYRAKSL
jgi:surface protein